MIKYLLLFFLLINNVISKNIYCSNHDACRNYVSIGSNNIYCGGGERTCKNIYMKCGTDSCLVQTQGSGHDAFQNSEIDAKTVSSGNNFQLICKANGFRDCTNNIIWCPISSNTQCICSGCPSSVTMKCVNGINNCNTKGSAKVEYYNLNIPTTTTIVPTTTIAPTTSYIDLLTQILV